MRVVYGARKGTIECRRNGSLLESWDDKTRELMKENEKIFVVKIGNRNYAHKLLLDKWLLAQVRQ